MVVEGILLASAFFSSRALASPAATVTACRQAVHANQGIRASCSAVGSLTSLM